MWLRLDDQIFLHPKIAPLSKDAKLLHLATMAYCAAHLTDGHIAPTALRMTASQVDVQPDTTDELIEADLWHKNGNGWVVHDFLEYNESAAWVKQKQALNRNRVSRWREAHANDPQDLPGGELGLILKVFPQFQDKPAACDLFEKLIADFPTVDHATEAARCRAVYESNNKKSPEIKRATAYDNWVRKSKFALAQKPPESAKPIEIESSGSEIWDKVSRYIETEHARRKWVLRNAALAQRWPEIEFVSFEDKTLTLTLSAPSDLLEHGKLFEQDHMYGYGWQQALLENTLPAALNENTDIKIKWVERKGS